MKNLFVFLMMLIYVGCITETIPELPDHVLDADNGELFTVDSIEFYPYSNLEKHVEVHYTTPYNKLTPLQQSQILETNVLSDAGYSLTFPADRNFFFDQRKKVGTTICYTIRYKTAVSDGFTHGSLICFEVP